MLRGRWAERREDRRDERPGSDTVHCQMRQRLVSIGDDFWIESDDGRRAYTVNGKALRLRRTLILEDADGRELARIRERVARVRDSMEIEDADGNTFTDGRTPVATVSTKWFRIADTYGVEIAPDHDPVVILAATVALDVMAHEGR